jgi:hypothetical protein
MAIARSPNFVIDCPDPRALAGFYGRLLEWTVAVEDDNSWATVSSPDVQGYEFHLQQVDDYQAPEWPGQTVPQQMHLDVDVDDLDAAEEATLALGAIKVGFQPGETFRVFLDPAGHPFCLCLAG